MLLRERCDVNRYPFACNPDAHFSCTTFDANVRFQVGIKYGGKGEVDVTGLEMELREPYKVRWFGRDFS